MLKTTTRVWVIYKGKRHKGVIVGHYPSDSTYLVHIPKWDKNGGHFVVKRTEAEVTPSITLVK